jgi:hypothetical protein
MASEYPPYVNGYGGIASLFKKIKEAAIPTKFTVDFMTTALGLKSSSYRAMIPLLKRLGFIDQANVPTEAYRNSAKIHSQAASWPNNCVPLIRVFSQQMNTLTTWRKRN